MVQAAPEFESAKKLAAKAGVPVKEIYEAAVQAVKGIEEMSEANDKLEKLRALAEKLRLMPRGVFRRRGLGVSGARRA